MKKWLLGILGAVIAGIVVYWITVGFPLPNQNHEPGISKPKSDDRVACRETVEGWYGESESNSDLWIVIQPVESPNYHPQPGPLPKNKNGKWQGIVQFGVSDKENIGEEFLVFIVQANSSASQIFSDYIRDSNKNKQWDGLSTLPYGAVPFDSVKVVRK